MWTHTDHMKETNYSDVEEEKAENLNTHSLSEDMCVQQKITSTGYILLL